MTCSCNSGFDFKNCCQPFLEGKVFPDTAEKLMRTRYAAYVTADIDYLEKTLAPESRSDFDKKSAQQWAKQAQWKGLKIISTDKGSPVDTVGTVEFIATYQQGNEGFDHHEVSQFRKGKDQRWYFVDGDAHTHKEGEDHGHHHHHHVKPQTVVRDQPKIGRNDPCVCGSGKKYKKCCGAEA